MRFLLVLLLADPLHCAEASAGPGEAIVAARRAWRLIEENRPVVEVSGAEGGALPPGIRHWRELSGWSEPEERVYGFRSRNMLGLTVVEARYRVARSWGGSRSGRGKYLGAVSVVPVRVKVAWGYRLDMSAAVTSVQNAGTEADPVAAMTLELRWRIVSPLQDEQGRSAFYLRGDGAFRELAGPFDQGLRERGQAALDGAREVLLTPTFSN